MRLKLVSKGGQKMNMALKKNSIITGSGLAIEDALAIGFHYRNYRSLAINQ